MPTDLAPAECRGTSPGIGGGVPGACFWPLRTNGRVSAHERHRSAREPSMKHGSDDMPIACGLTSAELRERAATLFAQFRSAVIGTEELRDGYAFLLPGDGKWIATIAKMIVAERECCPFLPFELVVQPNMW